MCMVDTVGGVWDPAHSFFFPLNFIFGAGGEVGECPFPRPLVYAELSF